MSASNKRPAAGSRAPARSKTITEASRRMRMGLLGSTALVAASLAVSPAFAQIATPAGGGTITRTGGSSNTTDQTGAGGGVLISDVSQSGLISVNGVTINNTTGAPGSDALRILGSTSGLNSTGVTLTGVNTLTTTVNGGAALYIQTNANMGVSITSSGSTFTGSYGINVQAPSGYVSFDASNQSQSFVANGAHIAGFNAVTGVNAQIMLGSSTFTGFDTGINSSNFYGSTVQMTGGSINALVTGIRTDATGGGSTIESQAAIVAPTGIHSTNTNGTTITTSGAGTINSTLAGIGTGILATSSGGSNAITINVGAAIGNAVQPYFGVTATTTGSSTGAINITTTAAIAATSRGLDIAAVSTTNTGTINIGADISAATAVYANIGSYNVTVAAGVNISSTANGSAGLYLVNGTMTATNHGTIISTGTGTSAAGVRFSNPNGTLTNSATGSITGLNGAYLQNGPTTITNAGIITGTGGSGTAGLRLGGGGSVNNSNAISGYDAIWSSFGGTLTNSGTLSGVSNGVNITGGAVALTNTGTISTVGGVGGAGLSGVLINSTYTFGAGTITNSGTITGGGDATHGYGVEILDGLVTLTNQAGGTISGGQGAILLSSNDTGTVTLQAGSTTSGNLLLSGTGARTLTIAGDFVGNLDATGNSGAVNLSLNTSATGYTLLHAGSGADSLTFSGSGSRSFSVDNLSGWETGSFTGGAWTLTGTGNANSFTSGVTVNGAALTISNTQQFQGATGLTLTGGGSITTTASLSNTRTLAMAGAGSLGVASGQTLTQSGVVSGAGVLTLNGPGTLVLSGNNTYTGGTVVNAGILRLGHTSAAGTGVIRMIDPQIDFAATGTYNNNISLEVADGQQAADPTILNNTSGGAITLAGRIYETGGVGGAGQYVTFNGGSITLTNTANSWAGVTRINSGAILLGTTGSISGASIVNNGTLTYQNTSAGTANQNISGSGAINIMGTGVTLAGAITTTGQLTISGPGSSLILGGSRSGASNTGVVLSATGGSLTVANGASLQSGQYNGVRITGANASVTNFGLLQNAGTGGDGTVGAGVYVLNGGAGGTTTVNNGSITDTGAGSTIQGRNAGVRHESGSTDLLVVNNYGLIVGDLYNGVENTAGGLTVNNFAGGYITATLGNGVSSASASAVSVTNAGVIGRNIAGTVTVNGYGVTTNGVLTLVNQSGGLITGTLGGIQSGAAGSSITNEAGGAILGNYGVVTAGGIINNSGLIRGFNDAIILNGATALTNNAGGLIVGAGNEGVFVNANGSTISNAGLIVNSLSGIGANYSVAITNSGVIASGAATDAATTAAHITRSTGTAIALGAGGSVTNLAGGQILGGVGVSFSNGAAGTLTNAGLIDGSTGYGVQMTGAGTITNQSGGTIGGATGSIQLIGVGAKTIDLLAGSTANGQILASATGTQTVNIAGTLNGAYNASIGSGVDNLTLAATGAMTSADLGAGADSFLYQGGSFSGVINAGSGVDSFTSALGAGSGSVNLTSLVDFETFAHQSGALTLTGTRGFSGGASVTGGTLIVDGTLQTFASVASGATLSGGGTITSAVTIADGGILANTQGSTLTTGALTLSSGSFINATFSGAGGSALFAVDGALTLDGTVNVASTGAFGFGVYGLMTYTGALTDNGLLLGTAPGTAQRMAVQTSVAGQVNIVHAPNELLFWDGGDGTQHDNGAVNGGAGVWTATGSEWTDAAGLFNGAMDPQPGFAIFQGAGGTVTVDDSLGAVGVTGIQFAANGYRIEGDAITLANAGTIIRVGDGTAPSAAWTATIASELTGSGGLVKTDFGTLILTAANSYTGGTTVNAGVLQVGAGGTTGSFTGAAVLADNATLNFNRSDNAVFNNAISGTGAVGVNGVVTLSGAITTSGGVDVYADGAATVSNVSVVSGAAVSLAANADVTVASGGSVSSTSGSGIYGVGGNTVLNLGNIQSDNLTVRLGAGGSLDNAGSIRTTASGSAVSFEGAGSINNRAGGVIAAAGTTNQSAGAVFVGSGSVVNSGQISGGFLGLALFGGGTLSNQSGGEIRGATGVTANVLATVTNAAGATIASTTGNAVRLVGSGSSITNAGVISAGSVFSGVYFDQTGTVTNQAGGSISNIATAVQFVGAGSALDNAGAISNTNTNAAVYFNNSGTVTNRATGTISSTNGFAVQLAGANATVTNFGSITAGQRGVSLDGANSILINSGSITGGNAAVLAAGGSATNSGSMIGTGGSGLALSNGGSVDNQLNGLIRGVTNGVNVVAGTAGVTNAGTITGTTGQGLLMQGGGTVGNTGVINGGQAGVRSLAALNLTSSGAISGSVNAIENVGVFNDSLTFLAGSTTTGAVLTSGGDDVVSLAGALDGALNAGDGADTVTLIDTASFTSTLDGGDGVDAFVLDGSGTGSLDIGQVLNFETRAMNGAGVWTLTGTDAATAGWTLNSGVLAASGGSAINDAAFVNIAGGGTLSLLNDETIGALTGSGFVDLGGGRLTLAGAETTTWAGVISGGGGVTIGSAYGLTLTGANTYSGATIVDGVLRLGASGVLADDSDLLINTGGVVELQGFDETVDGAFINGVLNGPGTLTAGVYALNGGSVQANLGTGLLFNVGGTSTLSGTSNTDLVVVDGGTLALGASDRIVDTADLQVSAGATFDLGAFDETLNVTAINGTLAGTGTLTAVQHQLDGATVNANLAGGSVHVIGGASTLNGLSSADLLSVLDGSLTLGASERIADTAILAVSSGATLNMGAFNETVAIATLSGTLNGTGTLSADEYDLNGATVNANLGAGALYNTGGVSTLNGTSGADLVAVLDGTLALGASDRLADAGALLVGSGATFDLGAFSETVDGAFLEGTLAGTGTLTASLYALDGATVNANLGAGFLLNVGGASTLNGSSAADLVAVLDGSLTLGASDRLLDAAELHVLTGATLDLGAFDETVSWAVIEGLLAGTGTLTADEYLLDGSTVNGNLGAGVLYSLGASTLNGTAAADQVLVDDGVLSVGASDRLADAATVSVSSGATLNLNAFNDTVGLALINGTLAGTGTLTAAQYQLNAAVVNANLGAGTLFNLGGVSVLNGAAAASQVSIDSGVLVLGANERLSDAAVVSVDSGATFNVNGFNERIGALFGTGDVNVGTGRLTFGGVESGFGGRLSGAGSLVHTGGLFTLLGDHTIASISNSGGELRFAGTTTGSLSASGGSVTGAGTIGGALTISNGAILSPGLASVQNGIGGFTAGGLTLNGATLAIDVLGVSGGNLIDQLLINGAATLTGGILAPTFQGTTSDFDFATRYLFLQANNLVGTFANGSAFTATALEGLFWRVRYDLAPNAAVLELRQLTDFDPGVTGTGNQRGVGQALSGGQLGASDDWAAVISLIAGLNAAERAAAFDSISGEPLADVTTSMFSANDTFLTAMRDGGMGGRNDGGEALNFVDSLSFVGGRENSADRLGDVLGAFDPSAATGRGAGGWVSAWSGDQTLDGKPGQATVESSLNGFAGGYGVRNGSMSIGGAGGVTRLEGDVVARQGHYESDLSHAAGYVAFDDGAWAADVTAAVYGGDLDTRRGVNVGAFNGTAMGNTHVEGQSLSASVARRFRVSDDGMIAFGVIGTASNASVDGYTETGAGGLSLQASGQERDWQSLQFSARATQDYRVNGQSLRIYGGAGVMALAGDRQATGDMRFTGAPIGFGTFTVEGAEAPPLAGLVDFGLEVGAGEGVTVSAGYRGLFSERLEDNQVGVKLQVSW